LTITIFPAEDDAPPPDKPPRGWWKREAHRLHRALRGFASLPTCPQQHREQIMVVLDGKCWWDVAADDRDGVWTEYCPSCRCPLLPGERVTRGKQRVDAHRPVP